jgi:Protein of unknown function (DUF2934)
MRRETGMAEPDHDNERDVAEAAYFIWEHEGRPEGRAHEHWMRAVTECSGAAGDYDAEPMDEEEKLLAGRPDVNMPALLTKHVPGG